MFSNLESINCDFNIERCIEIREGTENYKIKPMDLEFTENLLNHSRVLADIVVCHCRIGYRHIARTYGFLVLDSSLTKPLTSVSL